MLLKVKNITDNPRLQAALSDIGLILALRLALSGVGLAIAVAGMTSSGKKQRILLGISFSALAARRYVDKRARDNFLLGEPDTTKK